MIQTMSSGDFVDAFRRIRPDDFSLDALLALFDYFEEYELDTGEQIELDVIAICCDWCEYDSIADCGNDYDLPERDDNETDDEYTERATAWLQDRTQVIILDSGGLLVLGF